ncbi:alkylhydroperoxidase AhpD family core domain-containing protein [Sinomicrobium oceani]|uniref:Alkylhydroperoxidase AhpD family core domain-containing protein n=1 Tax=Sinomicrobium oceani TaxID=1150368 RepID=A0A1K1M9I9_9FLAO|nr:carboxymuconolactone decarboxylase family protein [Sinomicrobium oceani]SFW19797.1 alkylhydroperoxidase AhpD family core domain-containing protein [Sinomicrobium oceani]
MEKRINIQTAEPQAFKAMLGLEGYLSKVSISKTLKELIKIRSSQLNNCAFCINMHAKDALANGETQQRIFLLSAWREAPDLYTAQEQVALEMTEEITLIHQQGLRTETYQRALKHFTENEIAQLIMAVVTINSWNRIALSTHLQVED